MFTKIIEKPFKTASAIGVLFIIASIILNICTGFSYADSIFSFPKIVTFVIEGIVFILFVLTFFNYNNHFLYYIGIELLVFENLYNGNIYIALFLSSLLLVFFLFEQRTTSHKEIIIYAVIEFAKLMLVIPYGITDFFYYVGLTLFALCTIGCINLLFKHALSQKEKFAINLDDYKFSERQITCIKEIVLNNTTIKALAIDFKVSESAIKKDLSYIYDTLGITGKADLKALFIGYKFN